MSRGFWDTLSKPIIALSPMDGVTDAACRFIADKYGKPDILITEFTSVEGLSAGATRLLESFIYHKTSTPTVAQIFGSDPEAFYRAAFIVAEMGFNGVDINMGCPDHNVAKRGGGAGLILQPDVARKIIQMTKQGIKDWSEGKNIQDVGLPETITDWIDSFKKSHDIHLNRRLLPVSVKTRIGFSDIVTEDWISTLLEEQPANISLHGRTLKQLYTGLADWDEIGKAAKLVKKTNTSILGNGDIKSIKEAKERISTYDLDGVLIGRASFGNPWIFADKTPTLDERLDTAIEHCETVLRLTPTQHFLTIRKHLAWYCKGFEFATDIRASLGDVNTMDDVRALVESVRQRLTTSRMSHATSVLHPEPAILEHQR
jgi:tRNA-dihydrouridine synthase B